MTEVIELAPTLLYAVVTIAVLVFAYRIRDKLPEAISEGSGKLSMQRIGTFVFTAWTFLGWTRGVEISFEHWTFIAALWGFKIWQRKVENGSK